MKVVNFCAGPSAGKTTNALELASMLKRARLNVGYIPEYAYELVLQENWTALDDQLHVLGEQAHRQYRALDKLDWIVTDCPLFLTLHYSQQANKKFQDTAVSHWKYALNQLALQTFCRYDNLTYFVERGDRQFLQAGRVQNEEESKKIDGSVLKILEDSTIPYKRVRYAKEVWDDLIITGVLKL
jgi:hypothetical protein